MGSSPPSVHLVADRYRLLEPLGSGGMGTVWRGHDELLGRTVAVKEVQLPGQLTDADREVMRARTLREARAAARLNHPHAVTVYDVVQEDGRPWIVMELLDARSLADLVRSSGPVSPAAAARIGLDVLSALDAAHAAGIVHRDVKPGNVMVAANGRAVLTDFGIATLEGDSHLTTTGLLVGAPAYVAPERAKGAHPGRESDLWALGATLYAAVEGRPPFDRGNPMATLSALITEEIPRPLAAGPLTPVLDGLLTKDPHHRMGAHEARRLLGQARREAEAAEHRTAELPVLAVPTDATPDGRADLPADRTEVVRRPSRPRRPTTRRRRRPWVIAGLAAAVLLAGGIAIPLALTGSGGSHRAAGHPTTAPSPRPTPTHSARPSPTHTTPSPTHTVTPSKTSPVTTHPVKRPKSKKPGGVPHGFRPYHDPTGFSIAVPAGWHEVRNGSRVDFRDPAGGRFLRIDQTDSPQPDPVADWRRQADYVSGRLPGYRTLSISKVDYRGYPAADWQFEFGGNGDGRIRVVDRGFTVDGHGYAIYWSAPAGQWSGSLGYFHTFARTFDPA